MATTQQQGLESLFAKHTAKLYGTLRTRHAAKYRAGKLVRPAIPLPFTLGEFRGWVHSQFQFNFNIVIPCAYCNLRIDVGSFSLDHRDPWAKSLDSRFENLCLCCERCNECKGDFTERFYRILLELLDGAMSHRVISAAEVQKVLSLIRMGWGYRRIAYIRSRPRRGSNGQKEIPDDF